MRTTISPSAVAVVPAAANLYGGQLALPAVGDSSFLEAPRAGTRPGLIARAGAGVYRGLGRVLWVLGGLGEMLIVAYAFPIAILAIGVPLALFVRLLVGIVRAL
ncbi:MAG TPA: hypothetical protein VGK32_22745 [Vicinamibacterales bacterium]|jgi:hypothetical protein